MSTKAATDHTPARFQARTERLPYAFRFSGRLILLSMFLYCWNAAWALLSLFEVVPLMIWPSWDLPFELVWEAGFDIEAGVGNLAIAAGIVLPAIYAAASDKPGLIRRMVMGIVLSAAVQGLFFIGYSALGWTPQVYL